MYRHFKWIIVGSGFFGATIAERIANDLNESVLVIEKRNHLGGNSYSELDSETNIECHQYGSHIFHTSNEGIWKYINRFSSFNDYRHRVWTTYQDQTYSIPINLNTINHYYKKALSPHEAKIFLQQEIARDFVEHPKNLEEQAINQIGRPLYNAFIRGYTAKQWETDPQELPATIITRLPVRYSYDSSYFQDSFQGIPSEGYGSIFKKMLHHPNISIALKTDFFDIRPTLSPESFIVYTGPIDRFFEYRYGELGWRTLHFEKQILSTEDFQGTAVMNYADLETPYTRIHEFRHFHPERRYSTKNTVIFKEYSKFARKNDEPYYPIHLESDKKKLALYQEAAHQIKNVIFGGRLGRYQYYDMHQVIGAALHTYEQTLKNLRHCCHV